ncbi:nucleotide-diphospho-sugar transferase [Neocallimastix sp. 'constans']
MKNFINFYILIIYVLVFTCTLSLEENCNEQNVCMNELVDYHIKSNNLNLNNNQEKLIVSITSNPTRINYVKLVLESLVNQSVPFSVYHIVLVLAIPEFPNKENDLPVDLVDFINKYSYLIEILWYERNINIHKRLIPTLKKYPNNPILICDDHIIRKQWWIKMFLEDHKIYPYDIIFGASNQYLTPEYKWESYKYLYIKTKVGKLNPIKNMIVNTGKPMNGFGGTLYPMNTFTDKRFFDEDLFMKFSPSSDESWQWFFNVIHNETLRQSSIIYDYSKDIIRDLHGTSLSNINNENSNLILKNFTREFPDFKKKLDEKFKLINYKYCLCFETMLYSFYKNNNWFNGDILVIHDDEYNTSKFSKVNMEFIPKKFIPALLKFEIFGLTDYDKVLYIDSDTLVISSIYELFNNSENLICFTHETYLVENKEIWNNIYDGTKNTNLNNGVIFINKNMLDKVHIDRMLNLAYKYNNTSLYYRGCPDQDIMQEYFLENNIKVTLGSNNYNTIRKPWNTQISGYKYIDSIWHNYNNELNELYKDKVRIENEKEK